MDGYEDLIKTASWDKLLTAKRALSDAQQTMEDQGFSMAAESIYMARTNVTDAENRMRIFFKTKVRNSQ